MNCSIVPNALPATGNCTGLSAIGEEFGMDAKISFEPQSPVQHWIEVLCVLNRQLGQWQAALNAALQPQELGSNDFLALWIVRQSPPPGISQVDVARSLAVSPAQICAVMESLQARGWLVTIRRPDDRRRHCCSITATGEAWLGQILQQLAPAAEACLEAGIVAPNACLIQSRAVPHFAQEAAA